MAGVNHYLVRERVTGVKIGISIWLERCRWGGQVGMLKNSNCLPVQRGQAKQGH
ncbi:hypothetical protein [Xenorhabdus sp. IM139775]|uniref:hypothetical protein n=1 Tax=Xenorhabdus sp. IM139775 TaxID=3025876 RepID=UPI00235902B5|nr:hypothetical protein [Xenorhabdus sp. IM139775]MDC9593062.1 hypothetical protein [Xenorhabdus sp. IM139775]